MNEPGKNDEQAVIAAVQLLVESMEPSQREKLLSALSRGQQKDVAPDEVRAEENAYPIQPLLLTTDEHQHAENQSSSNELHTNAEASSERGRAGRLLEMYAAMPLATSSARRAQLWTRLAISAILLCAFFLSTFAAYEIGVHAGALQAAAQASACQGMEYIVVEGRSWPPMYYSENRGVLDNDNDAQYGLPAGLVAGSDGSWHSIRHYGFQAWAQCQAGGQMVLPAWRH
jgi:hypothetical protein